MRSIMLAVSVVGISFFLQTGVVYGSGPSEKSAGQGRQLTVRTDLYPEAVRHYTARPCAEGNNRTLYPHAYTSERQGVPTYVEVPNHPAKTAPQKIAQVPCGEKKAFVMTCPKLRRIEVSQAKPCFSPCLNEIRRMSAEIRKLERERGALEESVRANQVWQSQYREWYRQWQSQYK
jgi:hypothetical protein